jgi:hypothetical protein
MQILHLIRGALSVGNFAIRRFEVFARASVCQPQGKLDGFSYAPWAKFKLQLRHVEV